jgi:hypothetical protein
MGVRTTPWTQQCMVEANRFWFYSLLFSIILGGMQLFSEDEQVAGPGVKNKLTSEKRPVNAKTETRVSRRVIVRRLVTDGFDLFIPGSITGWIRTSPAFVGFASLVSTLLASKEIWDRLKDK